MSRTTVRAVVGGKYFLLGAVIVVVAGIALRDSSLIVCALAVLMVSVTKRPPLEVIPDGDQTAEAKASTSPEAKRLTIRAVLDTPYVECCALIVLVVGLFMRNFPLTVGGFVLMIVTSWDPSSLFLRNRPKS
jgi:hypothetical protein